uniref:Papain-like cysteine peptidase n=1 Tax=viral metagenome TaxID=1070528 RepID=A0A6C0E511_9ZZZZ
MKLISIGSSCDVGFFIKKNFKLEYYPFDWLWSNIDFVINTFERDYFEFTECEKLNPVWTPSQKHTYIFNNNCKGENERICSAVSVHDADFQSRNRYISNIPLINDKYKRRFKRLYDVLKSNEQVILIRQVLPKNQGAVKPVFDTDEKINYLSEILSKKFKKTITICVVDNEGFINENNVMSNIKVFNDFNLLLLFINNQIELEKV